MCFKQDLHIKWQFLKLVYQFTYLGSNISSSESDVNTRIGKVWTATEQQSIISKFDLSNKTRILPRCTTWTLTKMIGEKAG